MFTIYINIVTELKEGTIRLKGKSSISEESLIELKKLNQKVDDGITMLNQKMKYHGALIEISEHISADEVKRFHARHYFMTSTPKAQPVAGSGTKSPESSSRGISTVDD
ncbi:hypothetical protein BGX27_011244 [Mortierella sp. AM989]|nr:hypothetical protein BGX27_011244 [Mortierella sp. AM989]